MIKEKFSQAAPTGQAPTIKIDPGNQCIGVGRCDRPLSFQLGTCIHTEGIGGILLPVSLPDGSKRGWQGDLTIKDGVCGDMHHPDAALSRLVSQFARQEGIDLFRARGIIFTGFQVCLCSAMNHQVGANLLQQDGNDIKILQVFMDKPKGGTRQAVGVCNPRHLMILAGIHR